MTKQEKQIGSEATGSTGAGRGKAEVERWDYDNAQATAVQLWWAAVSTEGDEAWARTGDAVRASMTVEVARADTRETHLHANVGSKLPNDNEWGVLRRGA